MPKTIKSKKFIKKSHRASPYQKWIRIIPPSDPKFIDYDNSEYFEEVAIVTKDNKLSFVPIIEPDIYSKKIEWLYLFTINDTIVKIGGTRVGLKGRVSSYLSGFHIKERNKSGECSKTNGLIYNTFDFYLNLGCTIKMYGYKLPENNIVIDVLEETMSISPQTFHIYESIFIDKFYKKYNKYPALNGTGGNSDPLYKKIEKN